EERRSRMQFVIQDADPEYRVPLNFLYDAWSAANDRLYDGALEPPHLAIGEPLSPTQAASIKPTTNYGASVEIVIRRSLVIDAKPEYIVRRWWEGHGEYLADLVVAKVPVQRLMDNHGLRVTGRYHDYGEAYAAEINRLAKAKKLAQPPVIFKRRRKEDQAV